MGKWTTTYCKLPLYFYAILWIRYIYSIYSEAYNHVVESNKKNNAIILEHRYSQIKQSFKKNKNKKIEQHKLYKKKGKNTKFLIVTYGDGLIDTLKAKLFK